jgi:putative N6-adenine-specific DNA methylase
LRAICDLACGASRAKLMPALSLFAVAAPGLEPFATQELVDLGLVPAQTPAPPRDAGGVAFEGDRRGLYRANLHLRTATRVLIRLGEFYAAAFSELRKKAARLPWESYLWPGQPVAIRATCHKSRLYHSDAVAERLAGAIEDRLGRPSARRKPPTDSDEATPEAALVIVRLMHDLCTVSVDSSGEPLFRRGYRLATAKAPLRETLAAGLVLASGWDRRSPLLDPFCGSGTVLIEAALLARNLAPGRARRFAFMDWPGYDASLWARLRAEAEAQRLSSPPRLMGSDRDAGAIAAATDNAQRAGVAEDIEFRRCAVSSIAPPHDAGWVVTNPPYGVRVSENHELRNLYARFGQVLRARCAGWQISVLSSEDRLVHSMGLAFEAERSLALVNGGLKVKLARGVVPGP